MPPIELFNSIFYLSFLNVYVLSISHNHSFWETIGADFAIVWNVRLNKTIVEYALDENLSFHDIVLP